jgi:hypothetical protein
MLDQDALALLKNAAGAFEIYEKHSVRLYRRTKDGSDQRVDVEITDAGAGMANRYSVRAESEDGRIASGNPAATLQASLAVVHWGVLG